MLQHLFASWAGEPCLSQQPMAANGSARRYYRMTGATHHCVACVNDDVRENMAFVYYARFFRERGLAVPEIYKVSDDGTAYLQQDLGNTTLYEHLYDLRRKAVSGGTYEVDLYAKTLDNLVLFQTMGADADFSMSYPRAAFDRQSMQWDLNYFKYYFLKLSDVAFDEQLLEDDFQHFMDYLLNEDCSFFIYRDFQTRNIMCSDDGSLSFIDFQGGRQGAPQYDVASLLFSSKCTLSMPLRQQLWQHYLNVMRPHLEKKSIDADAFAQRYYGYVLIRLMQALGAYGYRGYYQHKDSFLKSIPAALANLRYVVESHPLPLSLPHLTQVLKAITLLPMATTLPLSLTLADTLTVTVCSFSYKRQLPVDDSGNGGGHVFDCRALPNPGRYPQYRNSTGRDADIIAFFADKQAIRDFLVNAQHIVMQSVKCYTERHFAHLMVSFGCTGGQHRSVYCAEQMADYLRTHTDCHVVLRHLVINADKFQ